MPKLTAATFRVRSSSDGHSTLTFTDQFGRAFDVRFSSAGLPNLIAKLQEAAAAGHSNKSVVQLSESTLNNKQPGVRLNVEKPKPFVPGPHGAFEFGTSADLSRVLIIAHVPHGEALEILVSLEDARSILDNLARMITLVAAQS